MKYLVRSVKYLIYFVIIFFLCIALVLLFSHQPFTTFPEMFKEGSLLPICLIMVGFAALYPAVGFRKARLNLDGEWKNYRDAVIETMKTAGYRLVGEDERTMKFRSNRAAIRFTRMWEDAITFELQEDNPYLVKVDGPSRDTMRIVGAVHYNYRMQNPQEGE